MSQEELGGLTAGAAPSETAEAMAKRKWRIGRAPQTAADWMTELKLLDESFEAVWSLGEDRTKKAEASRFQLGRVPKTQEEIDAEVKLRETERRWEVELEDRKHRAEIELGESGRRWEVELEDRKHRADLAYQQAALARRAESIRGWALVAVVVTIVISPWVAMAAGVPANDFSMYMVPVTGIAGTIIGYWFGQGDRLRAPTGVFEAAIAGPRQIGGVEDRTGRDGQLRQP